MGALLALPIVQERCGVGNIAERSRLQILQILFPKQLALLFDTASEVYREDEVAVIFVGFAFFVVAKKIVATEITAALGAEGIAIG